MSMSESGTRTFKHTIELTITEHLEYFAGETWEEAQEEMTDEYLTEVILMQMGSPMGAVTLERRTEVIGDGMSKAQD